MTAKGIQKGAVEDIVAVCVPGRPLVFENFVFAFAVID